MRFVLLAAGGALVASGVAYAGSYAPAAGQAGSTAIAYDDARFVGWATGSTVARGPQDIASPSGPFATYGTDSDAVGPAGTSNTVGIVSLGDGGTATLTFANPITNGSGPDFAVFENSFSDTFLELAFVEVSSNGADWFGFAGYSETPTTTQVASFGTLDPTNIHNLAGKYRVGFGTPFDLAELAGVSSLLNIDRVTHVRVSDVVGRITSVGSYTPSLDALDRVINDPYSTPFASGGFDLDAVGVINQVPEPATLSVVLTSLFIAGLRPARTRKER